MKCSVNSTHCHSIVSLTPLQLTEKGPTFYKFKLWLAKTNKGPLYKFYITLSYGKIKINTLLKKMRPLKWERKSSSNGEFQLTMVFRQNRLLYMRLIDLESGLELFWWPNRSIVCSVHGWMTAQTHSIHFGVMWGFFLSKQLLNI